MHVPFSLRSVGVVAAVAVSAVVLAAPEPGPTMPVPAPTPVPPAARLSPVWRLDPASHFEDSSGIIFVESIKFRGTANFNRAPHAAPSAANQVYQLTDLNWLVTPNVGEEFYVSGWGEYRIVPTVGMLAVVGHRMTVNVKWGSDTNIRRFDSGVIAMSNSQAGRTVDIVMHEVFPSDAGWPDNPVINPARPALRLKAAALPSSAITPYAAPTSQSEFLNGCYGECACPLMMQAMEGRFGVVPLFTTASPIGTSEWGLVNMNFKVRTPAPSPGPTPPPLERTFTGAGILQLYPQMGVTIAPRQRMRADVSDSLPTVVAQPQRFDSGLVTRTVAWPRIDVSIADNLFQCYNRVLHIGALPLRRPIGTPAPEPVGTPSPGTKPAGGR